MKPLLTAEQMRACDLFAIEKRGLPEIVLMEHAALAVVSRLQARFGPSLNDISGLILAGPGNNGADALAVARLLHNQGHRKIALFLVKPKSPGASYATQLKVVKSLDIPIVTTIGHQHGFIIDGIFGTGLARPPEGDALRAIQAANKLGAWKIAIDIPSGLNADTGRVLGAAFEASETVSLGFLKRGLVTGEGPAYTGKLSLADIQIPPPPKNISPAHFLFEAADAKAALPKRSAISHKGIFGHVFSWLGAEDKEGASALAALAALRCGVGLSTLVGSKEQLSSIKPRLPLEVMTHVAEATFWQTPKGVVVLGPGLGTGSAAVAVLNAAIHSSWPLVLDADALNILAEHPELVKILKNRKCPTVLTPHPKEASRLLGSTTAVVEENRFEAADTLVKKLQTTVVLKGKGSLIADKDHPTLVVTTGCSNLAKGGSGDLLSGLVASCVAMTSSQGISAHQASALAVYLQGAASELVAQRRGEEFSALASEIGSALPDVISALHGI